MTFLCHCCHTAVPAVLMLPWQLIENYSGSDATMTSDRELGSHSQGKEACHHVRLQSGQTEWGSVVSERPETSVGFHINNPLRLTQMVLRTASKDTFLHLCMCEYVSLYVCKYVYKIRKEILEEVGIGLNIEAKSDLRSPGGDLNSCSPWQCLLRQE